MEFAFFVFLIALSWRLRRAARRPQRLDVHHHHHFHFHGSPGESKDPVELGANVIRFPKPIALHPRQRVR